MLTVVNGTTNGAPSGAYTSGEWVPILADPPPFGMMFDAWAGDVSTVVNTTLPATDLKMTATDITVTATFKSAPTAKVALTVVNGSGSGSYAPGVSVAITADAAPAGKEFDQWTGDKATIDNVFQSAATILVPSSAATVTATYKNTAPTPTKKTLTVTSGVIVNGDVSTASSGEFLPGTTVSVRADAPPTGKIFNAWTGAAVSAWTSASTSLVMPNADAALVATYRDASGSDAVILLVDNGGYSPVKMTVTAGTRITIQALDRTAEGFVFKCWSIFDYVPSVPGYIEDPYAMRTTVVNISAALVTAEYVPGASAARLTMTAGSGGTVDPASGQVVALNIGEAKGILAMPEYGCDFAGWTTSGGAAVADPSSAETTVTLGSDGSVTASFTSVGITSGSTMTITSTGGDFAHPRAVGSYEWRGKARTARCWIPADGVDGKSVQPVWGKRVMLYDRRTVAAGLLDGSLDSDLGDPIATTVTATDKRTGASGSVSKKIVGPRIESITDAAGAVVTSLDGIGGAPVTLKGRFFGAPHGGQSFSTPKGYVLVETRGKPRFIRCAVPESSYSYADADGVANRGPMNVETGESSMVIILPRLKSFQAFGDRIAVDNGVGLAVFILE